MVMSTERPPRERPGFLRRLRNLAMRILASVPAQIKIAPTLAVTVAVTFSLSLYTYTTVVAGDTGWELDGARTSTSLEVTIDRALEVKNDIRITGSVLEMAGSVCDRKAQAGTGRICFDGDAFRLSQSGGRYLTMSGVHCWDANANGKQDPAEDRSGDGVHDARDCAGLAGPRGPRGATGEAGDAGQRGLTGDKGDTGPRGAIGVKGETGGQGDPGERGLTGVKGDRGGTGLRGFTGLKGDKGYTVLRGPTGLKGDKGDTGDPGIAVGATAKIVDDLCSVQMPDNEPIVGGTAELTEGACRIVLSNIAATAARDGQLNVQLTPRGDPFKLVPVQIFFQMFLEDGPPFIWVFDSEGRSGSFDFLVQVLR